MDTMKVAHRGLQALLARPLAETIRRRRTHRVSRGADVPARSLTYTSPNTPAPLTELEERPTHLPGSGESRTRASRFRYLASGSRRGSAPDRTDLLEAVVQRDQQVGEKA
jgi:hypothetical protein